MDEIKLGLDDATSNKIKKKTIKFSESDSDLTVNSSKFENEESTSNLSDLCLYMNNDSLEVITTFSTKTKYLKQCDFFKKIFERNNCVKDFFRKILFRYDDGDYTVKEKSVNY